jgi:hypothetical protein
LHLKNKKIKNFVIKWQKVAKQNIESNHTQKKIKAWICERLWIDFIHEKKMIAIFL